MRNQASAKDTVQSRMTEFIHDKGSLKKWLSHKNARNEEGRSGVGHKRARIEIYIFPPRPLHTASMDTSTSRCCEDDKGGMWDEGRESE